MKYIFDKYTITYNDSVAEKAATLFYEEIALRTGIKPEFCDNGNFVFEISNPCDDEDYSVKISKDKVVFAAHRLRGLIYAYSFFLRKCTIKEKTMVLSENITGEYSPKMKIRGHELGFTDMSNTYETWDKEQYRRYILDLMAFGINTVGDSIENDPKSTEIMKISHREALISMSEICTELDLDFSVWHAVTGRLSNEETAGRMKELFKGLPKLNVLFLPGGDPGDMEPEAFIDRCIFIQHELRELFPELQMWPSAQAPHEIPDWGERFIEKMSSLPDEITGIIYGPNHALPLDELRRRLDDRYPIRAYPDIGHNVRCETPVNFTEDDWHYAYASTLSREAVNPRMNEFKEYHRQTRDYVIGNVTYSEGVNDDVNKATWSLYDFDPNYDVMEALKDYSRFFFPECDPDCVSKFISYLEENWKTDPIISNSVFQAYDGFKKLLDENPSLNENWRFLLLVFRSQCDMIVRDRRIFELGLIEKAKKEILDGNISKASEILDTPFGPEYVQMRSGLDVLAAKLFKLIGIQLDTEHFGGMNWERGCVLDTIDMPITDRKYLQNRINQNPDAEYLASLFKRNSVEEDEMYFSFAEHGFKVCGRQEGEYYYNYRGDQNADGALSMCMVRVYDHFNFKTEIKGLSNCDYVFRVTYKANVSDEISHHKICVNGKVIYDGPQYGGIRDTVFEEKYLCEGYWSIVYDISADIIRDGSVIIEITEPSEGFMMSEYWVKKKMDC